MDQKKTAFMGLFAAAAIILGYVESLIPFFAGIPGSNWGLRTWPYFLSWRNTPEGSGSCLRCPHPGSRISLRKYVQHSLQSRRSRFKPCCDDFYAEKIRIHRHGDQCFRRRFPQYRAACRRRPDRGEFRCSLLCSRSLGLRGDHRTSYRFSYTGSPEAGTPVNLPGIRRSRHNIRISNAELPDESALIRQFPVSYMYFSEVQTALSSHL